MSSPFRMLALDIDGTLIDRSQVVAKDVQQAVAAAEAAGLRVVLTTGRIYSQTVDIWRQLGIGRTNQPMALVSGAMVSDAVSGMTLYHRPIAIELARRLAGQMQAAGHSALAFLDPWRYPMHYYLAESDDADFMHSRWMKILAAQACVVPALEQAGDVGDVLRLTAVVPDRQAGEALAERLSRQFSSELQICPLYVPAYDTTIVEATARQANKWTALMYIAQGQGVSPNQIVAAGDDANDVPMLRHAGLSAAMPRAPLHVQQAADMVAHDGLAAFIHDVLAGKHAAVPKAAQGE